MTRLVLLPALVLAGCNSSTEETVPPPVTQAEAQALEDAAAMLDEQRMPVQEIDAETEESESQ